MRRVARLAKIADNAVGLDVDVHSGRKERRAGNERNAGQPVRRIIVGGRDEEDPAALHQRVERIEERAHQHDGPRHPVVPAQLPREDERTVEIVQFEQQQERQTDDVGPAVGQQPERQHRNEDRYFHQEPAQVVVERRPPIRFIELPVTRVDEIERNENHDGHDGHNDQKNVECVGGYHQYLAIIIIVRTPAGRCRSRAYCRGRRRRRPGTRP